MKAAKGAVSVFVLEDHVDARKAIALVLREVMSVKPVEAGSFREMTEQKPQVLRCSLAVLDVNLGSDQESGIDAYRWLRQNGFRGEIVFLTGHASNHPLVRQAHALGEVKVLSKPITLEQLILLVQGVNVSAEQPRPETKNQ